MPIKRIWHGWTNQENADAYEQLLYSEVFPSIEAKAIPGYLGIELLRRECSEDVEFITIMTFNSLQNVIDFQGEDYQRAYVPPAAREVLARWEPVSSHYQVRETRDYR